MRITLSNLTEQQLLFYCDSFVQEVPQCLVIFPSTSTIVQSPNTTSKMMLMAPKDDVRWSFTCTLRMKTLSSGSWRVVDVGSACPWRIYHSKVSDKHHRLLIIPRRNLCSFLSEMPDSLSLSSLLLPGTHDSLSFYGWPVAQCQSPTTPLAKQLNSGIRVLDVRLAVKDSCLISYHGSYPERVPFQEILSDINAFLTNSLSCQETIVMSIKQEDFSETPPPIFSQLVHKEIMNGPGGRELWFFENRIPLLGEVRGKIVLFSRFGGDGSGWEGGLEGLGIHPTTWPDSSKYGFEWNCKETLIRTHDWYDISSFLAIPEKVQFSTQILLQQTLAPTLTITYFSASSFPLALPSTIACGFGWPSVGFGLEGVNSRVGRWLIDILSSCCFQIKEGQPGDEPKIRGWTFMDFYADPADHGVVPLLVECNFRGRSEQSVVQVL